MEKARETKELLAALETIKQIADQRKYNPKNIGALFELLRDVSGTASAAIAKARKE